MMLSEFVLYSYQRLGTRTGYGLNSCLTLLNYVHLITFTSLNVPFALFDPLHFVKTL